VNWFQIQAYFKYLKTAKYKKGHRIHPPFAFDLVRRLFYEKHYFYHFETIDEIRVQLAEDHCYIEVTDFGAGSKKFKGSKRKVSGLLKHNATPKLQGELISRFVSEFKPKNILELGTSLGIGTLYLSLPNSKAKVITLEGCINLSNKANQVFKDADALNVEIVTGKFEDTLPSVLKKIEKLDMVYFDGHHNYEATINYFNQCLAKASESSVFIFDDIHWSAEMERAWNEIISHDSVSISFDLFKFGIAILNKEVKKQHYIVKWP